MLTALELAAFVGRVGTMTLVSSPLRLRVRVLDVRQNGELSFRVAPLAGDGEVWVPQGRLTLDAVEVPAAVQPRLTLDTAGQAA